jgi:hypothetical protein
VLCCHLSLCFSGTHSFMLTTASEMGATLVPVFLEMEAQFIENTAHIPEATSLLCSLPQPHLCGCAAHLTPCRLTHPVLLSTSTYFVTEILMEARKGSHLPLLFRGGHSHFCSLIIIRTTQACGGVWLWGAAHPTRL